MRLFGRKRQLIKDLREAIKSLQNDHNQEVLDMMKNLHELEVELKKNAELPNIVDKVDIGIDAITSVLPELSYSRLTPRDKAILANAVLSAPGVLPKSRKKKSDKKEE